MKTRQKKLCASFFLRNLFRRKTQVVWKLTIQILIRNKTHSKQHSFILSILLKLLDRNRFCIDNNSKWISLVKSPKRMRITAKMSSNIATHAAGMFATHGTHSSLSLQALAEQKTLQFSSRFLSSFNRYTQFANNVYADKSFCSSLKWSTILDWRMLTTKVWEVTTEECWRWRIGGEVRRDEKINRWRRTIK